VANIKSQKKRILTNEKARQRNNAVKSELKTAIRAVNAAVESTDKEAATTALVTASRKLDKAVSKGVLHKNNAANRKSAISKKVAATYACAKD
jgi:small subunit ribosomal protein S20